MRILPLRRLQPRAPHPGRYHPGRARHAHRPRRKRRPSSRAQRSLKTQQGGHSNHHSGAAFPPTGGHRGGYVGPPGIEEPHARAPPPRVAPARRAPRAHSQFRDIRPDSPARHPAAQSMVSGQATTITVKGTCAGGERAGRACPGGCGGCFLEVELVRVERSLVRSGLDHEWNGEGREGLAADSAQLRGGNRPEVGGRVSIVAPSPWLVSTVRVDSSSFSRSFEGAYGMRVEGRLW